MKTFAVAILSIVLLRVAVATAQDVIPLYPGTPPVSTQESYPEKQYFSKVWNTDVVTNVTRPTLTVFKPSPELKNGAAIVICPGGGFMALSISSEGTDVAKYLAAKGMTAFVLKYRLAHTGEDATQEFGLAPESVAFYQKWTDAHKSAELHMYAQGGHGFGMRAHNLPTDHWIDRFSEWLQLEGFLNK
jgi:acetyl esterase/lipase